MMRRATGALLALLVCTAPDGAQSTEQGQQPGPELKKLEYFIGTWRAEGVMKPSAFGPGGKVTNTTSNEWILGRFFYLTHHHEQNPSGTYEMLSVTGYDRDKKVYMRYSFSPGGGVDRSEGTLVGDTWTWTSDYVVGGKTVKTRGTDTPTSATTYDFKWEVAVDEKGWTTVQEGKATRVE